MLGHERTRLHRVLEFIGYIALTVFVVIGTIALVFYARGYYYNPRSGEIVQNGLVLLASEPVEADVYLDGTATGKQTQWRSTLSSGEHTIALRRSGYREWRRTFELKSGEVLWLAYPLLIPQNLASREVARLTRGTSVTPSPNSSRIALSAGQGIRIVDTNDPFEPAITLNIADQFDDLPGTIREVAWSDDNDRLLITITDGKTRNIVIADIRGDELRTRLVTPRLEAYSSLQFVPERIDRAYGLRNKGLWQIAFDGDSPPQPRRIAERVDKFAAFDEAVVTWEALSQRVIYTKGDQSTALALEPLEDVTDIALSQHEDDVVVAVSSSSKGLFLILRPSTVDEKLIKQPFSATKLSFSLGANYLAANAGKDFYVYEIERARFYDFSLPAADVSQIRWATGAHLTGVADGQAVLFDFTGDNLQRFGAATNRPVMLSPDQSHVIHSARSTVDNHHMLVGINLTVQN